MIPFLYAIRPAGISDLSEIRARVENDARGAKAREQARLALAKALPAPNIDAVGAKVGLPPTEALITRSGHVAGFAGDISPLVNAAMSGKVGEIKGPIAVNEGAVVFQVVEAKKVDAKAAEENRASYAEMLRQQEARNLRTVLLQRLRKESTIDVNTKLLEQKTTSSQAGS